MNNNLRCLLRAVATNDIKTAKAYTKIICNSDKSQSNKVFCEYILNTLHTESFEVPYDIKGFITVEDVSKTFIADRYYLTERDAEAANRVETMYKASKKLAEINISYLNSLLLYGESGTGKTMLGRYLAYRMGLPLVYLNLSNIVDSYLGNTGKNIYKVFEYVKKFPCVFMLDEIDAIGMGRKDSKEVGELSRITISLMQCLDQMPNDSILIGATNRIDILDKALLRRMILQHEVEALTYSERQGMVKKFLNDVRLLISEIEIAKFCKADRTTAQVISELIQCIAKSIVEDKPLSLLVENIE